MYYNEEFLKSINFVIENEGLSKFFKCVVKGGLIHIKGFIKTE